MHQPYHEATLDHRKEKYSKKSVSAIVLIWNVPQRPMLRA
jgi:hypothetical protein